MSEISHEMPLLPNAPPGTADLIRQLKESGQPVVLTVNGGAELIVQDAPSYQKLLELVDRLETIDGIRAGLEEMKAGKGRPAEEVLEEIRCELNIPRRA